MEKSFTTLNNNSQNRSRYKATHQKQLKEAKLQTQYRRGFSIQADDLIQKFPPM